MGAFLSTSTNTSTSIFARTPSILPVGVSTNMFLSTSTHMSIVTTTTDITTSTTIITHAVKKTAITTDWISPVLMGIILISVFFLMIIALAATVYLFTHKNVAAKKDL